MDKLQIRPIAAKLMEELCIKCDTSLNFKTTNAFTILPNVDKNDVFKAVKYLCQKGYITKPISTEDGKWECSITADGIDWVEDYLNIDHSFK